MKKNIKYMLSLVLCAGLLQSTLQAGPFPDFCRNSAALIAAAGYWTIVTKPASQAYETWNAIKDAERALALASLHDLKDHDSLKYHAAQAILKEEGLKGFEGYAIKVVPHGVNLFKSPSYVGNNTMLFPDDVFSFYGLKGLLEINDSTVARLALSRLDSAEIAAIWAHEHAHAENHDKEKELLLKATAPFAIAAAARVCKKTVSTTPHSDVPPTIMRSLLRIPRALVVVSAALGVENWYSRKCERNADARLQHSPKLALKLANAFEEELVKEAEQNQTLERLANRSSLAQYIGTPNTVSLLKNINYLSQSHPPPSERIEYLTQWAAEAKKKQENNK